MYIHAAEIMITC